MAKGGLLVGLLVGVAATLPGCAGWQTWPPSEPTDRVPARDNAAVNQTMTLALARVIADYPPRGGENQRIAVNLPSGQVSPEVYRRIARDVEGEPGVDRLVAPLSEANMSLPVYHVAGVKIRTNTAYIDVLRPIFGVDELDRAELTNDEAYQGYSVRLEGGIRPWRVTWVERFTPGVIPTPALNPIEQVRPSGLPPAAPAPSEDESPDMEDGEWEPAPDPASEPAEDPSEEPGEG
ncbi:hypothetical protein AY599_27235 [Leptolyngbya valderiana BDU 20041]|nr:hypothetical protein AY599_27235 [Leptolyngbya valderiana BDU 20041]